MAADLALPRHSYLASRLRYGWLGLHYVAQYAKTQWEYRANFFIEISSYLLWILIDAALIYYVLLPSGHLLGWTLPQVMLMFGLHMAALGAFFLLGLNLFYLPGTFILEGQLDRLLVRPLNPYFQLMVERVSAEDVVTTLVGAGIAIWSLTVLGVPITLANLLLLTLLIWGGALCFLGILTATSALSFWLKDRMGLLQLVLMTADQIASYPLTIYPRLLRVFFTVVVPLGFIAFYPSQLFFPESAEGRFLRLAGWLSPLVGLGVAWLGYRVWRWGLRSYESVGS